MFLQEWRASGTSTPLEDGTEAQDFVERDLGCHPLSIVLTAPQAGQLPSLAALREAWRQEALRLARLPRGQATPLTSLEVSLSCSLEAVARALPEAVVLWGLLGLFPEGLSGDAWQALFGRGEGQAAEMRRILLRLNVAYAEDPEVQGCRTLRLLPALRHFILDWAGQGEHGLTQQMLAELAYPYFYRLAEEACSHHRDDKHQATLDALLGEFTNLHHFILLACSLGANWVSRLSELSSHLLNYYQWRVLLGMEIFQRLLPLQQRGGLARAAAQSSECLGDLQRHLGQLDEAEKLYLQATDLYRVERSNLGLANTLLSLGELERGRGNPEGARAIYVQARGLYVAERDSMGRAYTCAELARVSQALGETEAADSYLAEALVAARASNVPDALRYVEAVVRELRQPAPL